MENKFASVPAPASKFFIGQNVKYIGIFTVRFVVIEREWREFEGTWAYLLQPLNELNGAKWYGESGLEAD